jgi:hypothetical protein
MKINKRKIGLGVILLLLMIQLLPTERNNSQSKDAAIVKKFPVNAEVQAILEKACYDCHSNNTIYPWYASIQPVSAYLANHIKDGKRHLNFDDFLKYRPYKQFHKLEEIDEVMLSEEMPLWDYAFIHPKAKLQADEVHLLIEWSKQMRDSMHVWYPQDSLERPKH